MDASAEIRYWWDTAVPEAVRSWFHGMPVPAGGGAERADVYLLDPAQTELGIKLRGGAPGAEIKGLVSVFPPLAAAPFDGRVELWAKWTSPNLRLDKRRTLTARKTRWLREYETRAGVAREVALGRDETPAGGAPRLPSGCNVELTRVLIDGRSGEWWTLGVEAFGDIGDVRENLGVTLRHLVAAETPGLAGAVQGGYPSWLARTSRSG